MPYQSTPGTEDDETFYLIYEQKREAAKQRHSIYQASEHGKYMRRKYYEEHKERLNSIRKHRVRDDYYARKKRYSFKKAEEEARKTAEDTEHPQTDD